MSTRSQHAGSWLDPFAAAVPAAAATWSAALLAPLFDLPAQVASPLAGVAVFALGWWTMRMAAPAPRPFELRIFQPPEEDPSSLDVPRDSDEDVLLLDQPLAASMDALAELLLDDPLPSPDAQSRVVQLFPAQPAQSPGDLKRRIDRHLGLREEANGPLPAGDASDSLRRALDELRQTLARR